MTGDQVIASYVAQHGEQILIAPEATGFNLLAWLGPLAGLVLACGGMFWLLRRWAARREGERGAAQPAVRLDEDDPYLGRLQRELEELR